MEQNTIDTEFFKRKIYEKLDYLPQPESYKEELSWVVQQQIAATNGIHYVDRIGKLTKYPIYNLPVPKVNQGIMLDIGCGWGRWLVAGANKGYVPIGIDLRLEFCQTARKTLNDLGKKGYTLVADLRELPFKTGVFDLIWSFSVIQHTHKERMLSCLQDIQRILNKKGFTYLEFPNKNGVRNKRKHIKSSEATKDDYNSWCVRYYSIDEYSHFFKSIFGDFTFDNHSFIGIGILPEDLKYVSLKKKLPIAVSLAFSFLANYLPILKYYADSIYIKAYKNAATASEDSVDAVKQFWNAHSENPDNNLNLQYLIQCPVSGGELTLSSDKKELISLSAGLAYPIINDTPILIPSEARKL